MSGSALLSMTYHRTRLAASLCVLVNERIEIVGTNAQRTP